MPTDLLALVSVHGTAADRFFSDDENSDMFGVVGKQLFGLF